MLAFEVRKHLKNTYQLDVSLSQLKYVYAAGYLKKPMKDALGHFDYGPFQIRELVEHFRKHPKRKRKVRDA